MINSKKEKMALRYLQMDAIAFTHHTQATYQYAVSGNELNDQRENTDDATFYPGKYLSDIDFRLCKHLDWKCSCGGCR